MVAVRTGSATVFRMLGIQRLLRSLSVFIIVNYASKRATGY